MPGGLTGTVTNFQDNQVQTNFWAAFLSEANTINTHLTAIANGQAHATQALVTQIQNYQQFGARFRCLARCDLRGPVRQRTAGRHSAGRCSAAVKGLTGILNGDKGDALAADNAMITAAGQGFVADAMDVSGNNIAIGGGTYVGTATTVATATSVHGLAQGSIPVTANPNIANGTGGSVSSPPTTRTTMAVAPGGAGGGGPGRCAPQQPSAEQRSAGIGAVVAHAMRVATAASSARRSGSAAATAGTGDGTTCCTASTLGRARPGSAFDAAASITLRQ